MEKKKLPIGIQTFAKIRDPKENYIYVDKTEIAYQLVSKSTYYFLSRPRRFGKSLFVDTLDSLFSGSKEHFEGLFIYDKWDWTESYPVIRIDFTSGDYSTEKSMKNKLNVVLNSACERLSLNKNECYNETPGLFLENIIKKSAEKSNQKIVILIDEYDKPILDNITRDKKEIALIAREMLRTFYSAIKQSDQYLKFVFMTGVSKFSRLNLFSGLNNIEDITIDSNYATITGYTQDDLETHFKAHLQGLDKQEVKKWYNGYNYFGEPIYNPYDVLLFFSKNGEFRNYWWQTGNPTFFIEKLKEENYFLPNLENIEVSEEVLNAFDVEHIDLVALLWQTGYLTFDKKIVRNHRISYKMKIPNLEIQYSLNTLFLDFLTNFKHTTNQKQVKAFDALADKNLQAFEHELKALFAAIPYENYVKNTISSYEGYYASVMFAFISGIGFPVVTEDSTNLGRVDMTIFGNESTFILEFKVDMPAEAALHQIETQKYYEKYENQGNEIFLIGIHFNSEKRNIENMEWRKL